MKIAQVTPTIGAEISNIDLSQPLDSATQEQIYAALMKHLVLFFRDQDLSPQAQMEFATTFGMPVEPHPMAPKHPATGKRLLFVNRSFTQYVTGMLKVESDRLLQYLFGHIESPTLQVGFRWRNGSVAVWDNRTTQHFAVADYLPAYRRMHRVIIATDCRVDA